MTLKMAEKSSAKLRTKIYTMTSNVCENYVDINSRSRNKLWCGKPTNPGAKFCDDCVQIHSVNMNPFSLFRQCNHIIQRGTSMEEFCPVVRHEGSLYCRGHSRPHIPRDPDEPIPIYNRYKLL